MVRRTLVACLFLALACQAAAQGAAGLDNLPRGAQQCLVRELLHRDVVLEIANDATGKGGGSGGRGSPMFPTAVIPHFTSPAVPSEASNGRRLHQDQGSSANRDVEHVPLGGCKPSDIDTDQALHIVLADKEYEGPVPWVRDQKDCSTCVSNSVTGLIEASLARRQGIPPRQLGYKLSAQYAHHCGSRTGYRDCKSEQFMGEFVTMATTDSSNFRPCLQMPDVSNFGDVPDVCEAARSHCKADDAPGPSCFPLQPLNQADVQRYIRTFGGVFTPLTISNITAFREFFKQHPTGIWNDTSSCADGDTECLMLTYHHAVLLIGYNNTEGTYTALNSWGTGFANGGTFKIGQGVGGAGLPSSSWAMICNPGSAEGAEAVLARTARVVPLPDQPGCYNYTVNTSITPDLSALATLFSVSIGEVLRNNTPGPIPLTTMTYIGSAAAGECPSGPTCGSNQTSPICVLEVTHDQLTGNCTVTAQLPEQVDLEGLTLKVCIPAQTFEDYKTAVPACPAGQQPTLRGSCEACPTHTYKNTTGPQKCTACSFNSYQPKSGSTACLACPSQAGMAALLPAERAAVEQGCVKRNVSPKPGNPEVGTVQAAGLHSIAGEGVVPGWSADRQQKTTIAVAAVLLGVSLVVAIGGLAAWWAAARQLQQQQALSLPVTVLGQPHQLQLVVPGVFALPPQLLGTAQASIAQ